jgi:hypothetical protein
MSWEGEKLGDASLFPLPPQKNEDGDPYLPLVFHFPLGKKMSIDENSALGRPYRRILENLS